jgi:hypothetical protein
MTHRAEGSGNNVMPSREVPLSNMPDATTGKVMFWAGAVFVAIAALAAGGLLIPHLASIAFELKIVALASGIIGGCLMIGGYKL